MTLTEFQTLLQKNKYDAYIVTRNNMFLGQDVLPEENLIQKLTGFSGSAGTLIVFPQRAILLVDGRYDIQARAQTADQNIEVYCTRDSVGSWIKNNLHSNLKIAFDPWCQSISEVDYWKRTLIKHEFIEDTAHLLGSRITAATDVEIFELEEQFAGVSASEKISYLSKYCQENHLDAYLLCEPDSVSWLMNLRSNLIPDTPILRAYALVTANGDVGLYTNDFSSLERELANYANQNIGLNFNRTPKQLQTIMKQKRIWLRNLPNPITDWKATKNPIEIAGFKKCHIRDAVAVCRFMYWLETEGQSTDELGIVKKLREFRQTGENFYSDSFATIAGFGANGAIIHYQPTEQTNLGIQSGSVLLLDSGAQYLDGTTDITRTIAIGEPPAEIIDSYTQVLKAHIAVATAIFPPQTSGTSLDSLSRAALWRYGKDYAHGTGHGVGHFLSVHEGPQSISLRGSAPLKKDMVTSIEPGYYKPGSYGIRLENLALTTETTINDTPMLQFEPLTMVPFDNRLINKALLTSDELNWLNDYHRKVATTIAPLLSKPEAQWLKKATKRL